MESTKLFLLLTGICCVVLARQAHAECCTSYEDVKFTMDRGDCDAVGGQGGSVCAVTICADGVAMKGAYCGQGPCNIFGCNCDGGCLTGDWSRSFELNNRHYGVRIMQSSRSPYL